MAKSEDVKVCSKQVSDGWFRSHQCKRKAGPSGFCKQHDPELVEKRRTEKHAKWKAENDAKFARWERETALLNFCEGVDTETINTLTANGETLSKWLKETL